MIFLEALRKYLQRPRPLSVPDLDMSDRRRHLLQVLEERERGGESDAELRRLHGFWSYRIEEFATQMAALLSAGISAGWAANDVGRLVDVAISRELGVQASAGSRTKDWEIDRLRQDCRPGVTSWAYVARYAIELRAVRREGAALSLSPIGRLILDLPQLDAVRWILSVETALSTGVEDRWHLWRPLVEQLLSSPLGYSWELIDAWETLERLVELGVLQRRKDGAGSDEFAVRPERRALLEEISLRRDSPFAVLAEALIRDEVSAAIDLIRPATTVVQSEGATAIISRHARMMAHEIRNALVPVQVALEAVYRDAERRGELDLFDERRELLDGGIDRVFRFVEEMVDIAALGAAPTAPFELGPAMADALVEFSSELVGSIDIQPPGHLPPVLGHRHRFTLAIVNLIRNATQSRGGAPVKVHLATCMAEGGREILVTVDDDGPGVAPEYRSAVFVRGFTLRSGGSGQGLALVRDVVETEMGGRVVCEGSPLGGARFTLRLPVLRRNGG